MTQFFSDPQKFYSFISEYILIISKREISRKGAFNISLCGGSTPAPLFKILSTEVTNLSQWNIFWSDERYLPINDNNRNDSLAFEAWPALHQKISINVFPVPYTGDIEADSKTYSNLINDIQFDLSLLGLGEDGHTASLFPKNAQQDRLKDKACFSILNSPKPPSQRISVSYQKLIDSREILFITKEKGKEDALKDLESLQINPASYISSRSNSTLFVLKA